MTASNVAKDIGVSMVTRSGKEKEHIESEKTKMYVCYSSSGVQMEGDPKLFQESILINLGCLNYTLQKIASHNQLCKGTVLLTGETTKALPPFFMVACSVLWSCAALNALTQLRLRRIFSIKIPEHHPARMIPLYLE